MRVVAVIISHLRLIQPRSASASGHFVSFRKIVPTTASKHWWSHLWCWPKAYAVRGGLLGVLRSPLAPCLCRI